jgi:hypothetical protein
MGMTKCGWYGCSTRARIAPCADGWGQRFAFFALAATFSFCASTAEASSPLAAYAQAMARGDYGEAYNQLCAEDARALSRDAFVARYQALTRIPWIAAVLRSARAEGDVFTAIDWSYTRFARAGLLGDPEALARLPRRTYLGTAESRNGKLCLGLQPAVAPLSATVGVAGTGHDWFALYATFSGRCPRGARFLLLDLRSEDEPGTVALDCNSPRGSQEVVVPFDRDPKAYARAPLSARLAAVVPRSPPADPFRALPPELAVHPSFPVEHFRELPARGMRDLP